MRFLQLRDQVTSGDASQESLDALFVDSKTWHDSIDYISAVYVDTQGQADGLHIDARALTGTKVDVEYKIRVQEGDDWIVLRDWDADSRFVWNAPAAGEYRLRVDARVAKETDGGTEDTDGAHEADSTEHYREFDVLV